MQAIETHYLSPTNTKGSRVVATAQTGNRVVLACDSSVSNGINHARAAKLLRSKLHWEGTMVGGGTKNGMAWVFIDDPDDMI